MSTIGRKDDSGKLRWQLLRKGCVHALEAVIRVLMFGATKYGDENWKLVENAPVRYRDAIDRHLADLDKGIIYDPDTGEHQLAHVITNAAFILQLHEEGKRTLKMPANPERDIEPAKRPATFWRKHTPGEQPIESRGVERVEVALRTGLVFTSIPEDLHWGEVGDATITRWRIVRG